MLKEHCDQCDTIITTAEAEAHRTIRPAKPTIGNWVIRLEAYENGQTVSLCPRCRCELARAAGADSRAVL